MNYKTTLLTLFATLTVAMTLDASAQESRSITLGELFELAEENSRAIETGRTALREAQAGVSEALTGRLPDIEISASASYLGSGTLTERNWSSPTTVPMPHFGNNFALEASELIYGGGAVTNSIALARLREDMANIELRETRSRVQFQLIGFYLELCKMQRIMDVYDRNIALAEELIADTEARSEVGMALSNDVTRHQLRLQQLTLARTEVANTIRILSAEIATIAGLDPNVQLVADESILGMELPAANEEYWQEIASESAYSLQRGELAVEMDERAEQLARAERRPSVALIAANHFDGPITIEVPVINKNFNYWYVGIGVSFKLSSLYKTNRTIQRREVATELSQARLDLAREATTLAIHADYIRYEEAYVRESTHRTSVELAESNYHIIETRYHNDMAIVTDMTDAANQLLDAELQLTIARINILMRYFALQHTAGTLELPN